MMAHCVVLDGQVIHIGTWDSAKSGPMPAGAVVGNFDVTYTAKGAAVLASDYRALRAAEYPPIGDQIDALFHAGVLSPDLAAQISAVKAKYPKQ